MGNVFCTGCGASLDGDDLFCGKCGRPRDDAASAAAPASTEVARPVAASPGSARSPAGARVLVGALLPLVGIGLFVAFGADGCESTEGSVTVGGGPHGAFTFQPTGCTGMQPFGRFGVNLHGNGPNDGAVYVTLDPRTGYLVEVEVPGSCQNADGTDCTVFPVPRTACQTYDPHVEHSGVTVNDVRLMEGRLSLRCTLEDGTTVQGSVTFDGC